MREAFEAFLSEGADWEAWTPVDPPRCLTPDEEHVLAALLKHDFPGSEQLREQLCTVRVVAEAKNGDRSIRMLPRRDPRVAAQVISRVPVEGVGTDAEGRRADVLLHVVEGYLAELEVLGHEEHPVGLPVVHDLCIV